MVRPDGSTIESLVHAHQSDYYQALQQSPEQTDRTPFIEFMLRMITEVIAAATSPRVSPEGGAVLPVNLLLQPEVNNSGKTICTILYVLAYCCVGLFGAMNGKLCIVNCASW